ncbi:hypothetical protein R84B8_00620 [Treponema sp. R8-4-B8]
MKIKILEKFFSHGHVEQRNSEKKINIMKTSEIKIHPEISGFFSIKKDVKEKIVSSMKQTGFDPAEPVVIGKIKGLGEFVVDGHTRLEAAKEAGLEEIFVDFKDFDSLEEAKHYTFKRQASRRNLTQGEILKAASQLINKVNRDGSGRSSEILSKELGISPSTMAHAKIVNDNADDETKEKINKGETTINKAYQKLKGEKHKKYENENNVTLSTEIVNLDIETNNFDTIENLDKKDKSVIEEKKSLKTTNNKKKEIKKKLTNIPDDFVNILEIINYLIENGQNEAAKLLGNYKKDIK